MSKRATLGKKPRRNSKTEQPEAAKIAATIDALEQVRPLSAGAAKTIALLKSWLADDSGYDEQTWPALRKALSSERRRVGARRLFDG